MSDKTGIQWTDAHVAELRKILGGYRVAPNASSQCAALEAAIEKMEQP